MFNVTDLLRKPPNEYAAIDLGSNSFHMVVARQEAGELRILDRLKESVRLGFGLDERGNLSAESQERAMACLSRFGERISHLPDVSVRCVGTKTLRSARNSEQFLNAAEQALGHPIEVISGSEEARLIYQGVAHSLAGHEGRRLVADIGGGSTELIIGQQFESDFKESLSMGCVAITRRFFSDGKVTSKRISQALIACYQQIEPIKRTMKKQHWSHEVGASGTIKAAYKVCAANNWTDPGITQNGLVRICDAYEKHGSIDRIKLAGLSSDREPVFLGGVIVLRALFEELGLRSMEASQGALREGLLFDLVGRYARRDIRENSVRGLALRFHVDMEHAERVGNTAVELMHQVQADWQLDPDDAERYLRWSASLMEIGLDISHTQFHRHSAYICEHSDLPGFSVQEQQVLAFLVLAQRKKFPAKTYKSRRQSLTQSVQRLAVLLRLAVILHRARTDHPDLPLNLSAGKKSLHLHLDPVWLEGQPLVAAELETEAAYLHAIGLRLEATG